MCGSVRLGNIAYYMYTDIELSFPKQFSNVLRIALLKHISLHFLWTRAELVRDGRFDFVNTRSALFSD